MKIRIYNDSLNSSKFKFYTNNPIISVGNYIIKYKDNCLTLQPITKCYNGKSLKIYKNGYGVMTTLYFDVLIGNYTICEEETTEDLIVCYLDND